MLTTIEYQDNELMILDQTQLPRKVHYKTLDTVEQVYEAIQKLEVRGAPLIGVAAAYGVVVGIREYRNSPVIQKQVRRVCGYLEESRPTAVNLHWALNRMLKKAEATADAEQVFEELVAEAQLIHQEDITINKRLGEQTYALIQERIKDDAVTIMTHCNAGALATTAYGTATSVMYLLKEKGIKVKVFVCETRPLLQGARLTALELSEAGIDATLITDSMAATVLAQNPVDFVIVGADRVAANHDVANKVGTLGLSLLAKHYDVPFYVACPSPTFDKATSSGDDIVIEMRESSEVTTFAGVTIAPENIQVFNPSFDITPAENITAIITEHGILE